ncbi:MAG: Holliday junction branch migration protein RuvA [Clostridiales bacterium]|jgi:Holliday junction DNA helicase RuvA|nr:Holliday junction branch migration protein RuvA [Clostridiales bacterium]
MIYYIKGTIERKMEGAAVIDNNGTGWLVSMSKSALSRLPEINAEAKIFTYMQAREDGISLFGFLSTDELKMFTLLISVSGVGPKVALSILDTASPAQVMIAIMADDAATLSQAQGVGKKIAQRISLELKDKIKKTSEAAFASSGNQQSLAFSGDRQDAIDALAALGYSQGEAVKAVMEVALENMPASQIIRLALKRLASGG